MFFSVNAIDLKLVTYICRYKQFSRQDWDHRLVQSESPFKIKVYITFIRSMNISEDLVTDSSEKGQRKVTSMVN